MFFLASLERIRFWKNSLTQTLERLKYMQTRGRLIALMNRVRMTILRDMWDDRRREMIETLKKSKSNAKKKKMKLLLKIPEEVTQAALTNYFRLCKETASKNFIEWRLKCGQLLQ